MQVNKFYKKSRLITVIVLMSVIGLYIVIQYGILAFTPIKTRVDPPIVYQRGSIYDRNGKTLALQTNFYHIAITPSVIQDLETFSKVLAPVTGMTAEYIKATIRSASADFLYLKKKIDQNEKESIEQVIVSNKLPGIRFDKVVGRLYPENALASQAIGFMGDDGNGLSGIEYTEQNILSPKNTMGKNIYMTLDANLQYKLEQLAQKSMEDTQAESFMLIAAEAKTGEILSYISLPSANLNTYPSAKTAEKIDRPAVLAYEPGSVFKIFSVASFLDAGAFNQEEKFYCDGRHEIVSKLTGEKAVITCLGRHGWVTARQALEYSCNDALAQMSDKINADKFMEYIRDFGFGSKTGIEVPSETRGSVKSTSDKLWSLRSKPTISIGQEISVSPLQMVEATTALANKGKPVQLTLISKIVDFDGTVEYEHKPATKEQVIHSWVADHLLSCMESTAKVGTGSRASIGDVAIGVKTGTAQMLDTEKGGYSDTDFVSNCVAVFPVDNPEIILYIVITKAKGETYAGRIVAPVIADAADIIIDHLGLARANSSSVSHSGKIVIPGSKSIDITTVIPDFTGTPKRLLTPLLSRKDLVIKIQGEGWVVSQNPPPGTPVTENMVIELTLK
jgi:cell division protein FtsI (penicillin-binding protein 3)